MDLDDSASMMHAALPICTVAASCRHRRARAKRSPVRIRILSAMVFRSARAVGPKAPCPERKERFAAGELYFAAFLDSALAEASLL